jgi:hypothetical protein
MTELVAVAGNLRTAERVEFAAESAVEGTPHTVVVSMLAAAQEHAELVVHLRKAQSL